MKSKKTPRHRPRHGRPMEGYGTGFDDKLQPTSPLDLPRVQRVSDLVEAYGRTAIGARAVGEAADILYEMTRDPVFWSCAEEETGKG